jgi:hypothetical protein
MKLHRNPADQAVNAAILKSDISPLRKLNTQNQYSRPLKRFPHQAAAMKTQNLQFPVFNMIS